MFVKNIFKVENEKINKLATEKIEEKIADKDLLLLGFKDKFLLPKNKKSLELIHVDSHKLSSLLRLMRDNPRIFIDYLKKDNVKLTEEHKEVVNFYFNHKSNHKLAKKLTKLDFQEFCNNIKSISNRIKNTFIINEKTDAVLKSLDLDDIVVMLNTKNYDKIEFLNKIKCSSQLVIKNCRKNLNEFFSQNNYEEICKNVFFKSCNK